MAKWSTDSQFPRNTLTLPNQGDPLLHKAPASGKRVCDHVRGGSEAKGQRELAGGATSPTEHLADGGDPPACHLMVLTGR